MDFLIVSLMLSSVALCATGRIRSLVRIAVFQGLILGLLAVSRQFTAQTAALALATVAVKAVIFPYILMRAVEKAGAVLEPRPYVGYNPSIAVCMAMLGISAWIARKFSPQAPLAAAGAFFTMFAGLFVIISRRTAFSQVIGYLALEGGIYSFGLSLSGDTPAAVELGLLLDLFAAVFIMGIMVYRISDEFDHADMEKISFLKDSGDYD
ncbi:MAG: hypothetical protein WC421_09795 [Elusimicrobiales bacterium]